MKHHKFLLDEDFYRNDDETITIRLDNKSKYYKSKFIYYKSNYLTHMYTRNDFYGLGDCGYFNKGRVTYIIINKKTNKVTSFYQTTVIYDETQVHN